MENEISSLEKLRREVEAICLDNMLLRLLLQENWPLAQPLTPQETLSQARKEQRDTFRSHMPISDTTLASGDSDLESVEIALQNVLRALEATQQRIRDRVERAKETL